MEGRLRGALARYRGTTRASSATCRTIPAASRSSSRPALTAGQEPTTIIYRNPAWNDQTVARDRGRLPTHADGYVIEARIPLAALRGATPVEGSGAESVSTSPTCDADPQTGGETRGSTCSGRANEWDARSGVWQNEVIVIVLVS